MQTGGCARFGKMPNARARRLLTRVLCAGGFAVAGSVAFAVTATATEADQPSESEGLLGTLTSTVEPLTSAVEPVTGPTDSLTGGAQALTGELLGSDALLGDDTLLGDEAPTRDEAQPGNEVPTGEDDPLLGDAVSLVEQPLTAVTSAVGLDSAPEAAREATAEAKDRSFDRSRATEASDAEARDVEAGEELARDAAAPQGLVDLLGSVDSLLMRVQGQVPDVTAPVGDISEGLVGSADTEPDFGTLEAPEPLSAVTDVVSLLDLPFITGLHVLDPVTPLLAPLESIVHAAAPVVTNVQPFAGFSDIAGLMSSAWQEPSHGASATPPATMSAAPPVSSNESRDALPTGLPDSTPAVVDSSPDASPDDEPVDSRGVLRPSLLMTPVAGLTALHGGAPGAAISADQAGPSGHALLPEEAVLRARLLSAAAYARTTGAKPQREANDPPVSPD